MPSGAEIVTLEVDGQALQGWQEVHVRRSVEAAVIEFTMEAANPAWSYNATMLRTSKQVTIRTSPDAELGRSSAMGGDLLCTGYVDVYAVQAGPLANRSVSINGRSMGADAADTEPAKHPTGLVENQDLLGVANAFNEWELKFKTDQKLTKIPMVQRMPGESLFGTLEREARRLGLFLMGEPDGSINITKGTTGGGGGGLVEGESPLESYRLVDEMRLAYSTAHVRGQKSSGTDDDSLRQEETAENGSYGRYRPLIVYNEGSNEKSELKTRAEWELTRRNGARLNLHARVASWRDRSGALWAPQQTVNVRIESEALNQDLAIQSVTFHQVIGEGEGCGTWADLVLVYPEALGKKE